MLLASFLYIPQDVEMTDPGIISAVKEIDGVVQTVLRRDGVIYGT